MLSTPGVVQTHCHRTLVQNQLSIGTLRGTAIGLRLRRWLICGGMMQIQHEDLSRCVGQVLESMQRKGQQIRQLREYCDMLPVG